MEWTVSNTTSLGTLTSIWLSNSSRWTGSLWWNICLGARLFFIPWIIDAWLPASEKMWTPENNYFGINGKLKTNKFQYLNVSHQISFSYTVLFVLTDNPKKSWKRDIQTVGHWTQVKFMFIILQIEIKFRLNKIFFVVEWRCSFNKACLQQLIHNL